MYSYNDVYLRDVRTDQHVSRVWSERTPGGSPPGAGVGGGGGGGGGSRRRRPRRAPSTTSADSGLHDAHAIYPHHPHHHHPHSLTRRSVFLLYVTTEFPYHQFFYVILFVILIAIVRV